MELEERVVNHFHHTIDVSAQTIEHCTAVISQASEAVLNCLVSESKVICAGNGASGALSSHFASLLMNRYRQERPSLPCIALNTDTNLLSGIANDSSFVEVYAKQIQAIGQAGDILLILSYSGKDASLVQAVQAAHDRDMQVIALTGGNGGNVTALLRPDEIEIRIPSEDTPSIHLAHTLVIHTLIDLIEYQLFGA